MKLFIMGATGRTGRLITEQALSREHAVTAMVRAPGALAPKEGLRVVVGDPSRAADLGASVLSDQDVVISCLGQRTRKDATLLEDAAVATLRAMAHASVRRYLVLSQGLLFPSKN